MSVSASPPEPVAARAHVGTADYAAAPVPVREEIAAADGRAWQRLAAPGTWWTGRERVAIAAETRRAPECRLCQARGEALTPSAVQGEHDHGEELPTPAIEAVHRIATDASRLSRRSYQELLAAGLGDGQYVEIVGIVSSVISIDSFCRAIGVPPHPLPAPLPGEPSRYRPANLEQNTAWVPMLARAEGSEADLWGGRAGNVIRAMSLVPDEVRNMKDLSQAYYVPVDQVANVSFENRAISRAQIELIAGRVSALNECFY